MTRILWIGFGGFCGTLARYWLSGWVLRVLGPAFPYGTLAVNAIGSFALGAIMWIGLNTTIINPTVRVALTTGVLGGFTTYSTFNYETLRFFQDRAWLLGTANILATVAVCLAAGLLGWAGANAVFGK